MKPRSLAALAAHASGIWKATVETPNGAMENTFTLKVDGDKLTGTITMGQFGEAPISEGKVAADEMKLSGEVVGMDRTFEMTATRVK
jgi:hypothetical protein